MKPESVDNIPVEWFISECWRAHATDGTQSDARLIGDIEPGDGHAIGGVLAKECGAKGDFHPIPVADDFNEACVTQDLDIGLIPDQGPGDGFVPETSPKDIVVGSDNAQFADVGGQLGAWFGLDIENKVGGRSGLVMSLKADGIA